MRWGAISSPEAAGGRHVGGNGRLATTRHDREPPGDGLSLGAKRKAHAKTQHFAHHIGSAALEHPGAIQPRDPNAGARQAGLRGHDLHARLLPEPDLHAHEKQHGSPASIRRSTARTRSAQSCRRANRRSASASRTLAIARRWSAKRISSRCNRPKNSARWKPTRGCKTSTFGRTSIGHFTASTMSSWRATTLMKPMSGSITRSGWKKKACASGAIISCSRPARSYHSAESG